MVTVSHLVKKLIQQKPLLEEFLQREVINYGALAEEFKPSIESELGKEIKTSAIMMAIRRYSETIKDPYFHKLKFGDDVDLQLQSDLIEITVYRDQNSGHLIEEIHKLVNIVDGDFLSTITGTNELSIITNKRNKDKILKLFSKKIVKSIQEQLAAISLNIPSNSNSFPGLYYTLTKGLYWANISIIEIISTLSEAKFLFKEVDAPFAYMELKKIIEKHS